MNSISQFTKFLGGMFAKNSPSIMTGLAAAGVITTAVLTGSATIKAMSLLEEERERRGQEESSTNGLVAYGELSKRDIIGLTWKCYVPAAAVGLACIGCIIGANAVHLRRTAALASVYSITEAAFKEYRSKVVETIGHNRELKVRDEVAADTVKAHPQGSNEVIFTGKGEVLCFDTLTSRYFKSDIELIRSKVNYLNHQLMRDMFMPLNELYYELGLAQTKIGDDIGWDIERGMIDISFSSQLTDEGVPCLVLNYKVMPRFR